MVILGAVQARKDIRLVELVELVELAELLRTGHSASFAVSMVWRVLDRPA